MSPYRDPAVVERAPLRRDRRNVRSGLILGVVAAALGFGAYTLATSGGTGRAVIGWTGVIGFGVLALIGIVGAFGKFASCPRCGVQMIGVDEQGAFSQCAKCRAFARTIDRRLEPVSDDHVADRPMFVVVVPESAVGSFRFPDRCSSCGEPSTRTDDLLVRDSKHLENAVASAVGVGMAVVVGVGAIRTGGHAEYWVPVPYCARCPVDAVDAAPRDGGLAIRCRSLAFARSLAELNALTATLH